jgi:pilus assembly protein CpaE
MSPQGSPGKTTTAINLAALLARRSDAPRVCVIDADLQFGDVCWYLGLEPERTIVGAARQLNRLDGTVLESVLTGHPAGFQILACPLDPSFADEISTEALAEIMTLLDSMFDYLIVDTASLLDEIILAFLERADRVLFMECMQYPGLGNAKHYLKFLLEAGIPKSKIRLVLSLFDPLAGIDRNEVEKSLGMKVSAAISPDEMVPAAINERRLLVEFAPESPSARAFEMICDLVVQ